MPSLFAWLDHSDQDRRQALDLLDLMRDRDTRDELGLGIIRDAFADRLFPGTSTIQTRVRYFLFIPWMFQRVRAHELTEVRYADRLRQLQDFLRQSLVRAGETDGVIGFFAERQVQRLPSSVYWAGLRRLNILRFQGSEAEFRAALLGERRRGGADLRNDDGEPLGTAGSAFWDPELPPEPRAILDQVTFALTRQEAEYLQHRLQTAAPDSLLTFLLTWGRQPLETRFVWEHVSDAELPPAIAEELRYARHFSEIMHSAALVYNLMLAQESGNSDWIDHYRNRLNEWWDTFDQQRDEFMQRWRQPRLWALLTLWNVRIRRPTVMFVDEWFHRVSLARDITDLSDDRTSRDLVRTRERRLKGPRARLGNAKAREQWSGASGSSQLDYRWRDPVRGMVADLIRGLELSDGDRE